MKVQRGLIKFDTHPYAINWSSKNKSQPLSVSLKSSKKFWFICPDCNHEFDCSACNIAKGKRCPYCAIPSKKLCHDDNCESCFNKSFASSDKIKFWSNKNIVNPRNIFKKTDDKYLFNCDKCEHEFEIALDKLSAGGWCSYCYGKKLCETNCDICFKRSFASHEYSKCWSNANIIPPNQVALHCNRKFRFKCDKCNVDFMKEPNSILRGEWCRFCKNKTEKKILDYLKSLYPSVISEFNQKWAGKTRYDFMIPELKVIVELDGEQHFVQVRNWRCPEDQLVNDVNKTILANANGYNVIRLLQLEVFNNSIE